MCNITLIFTTHQEIGKCNSWELYKIIEEYKPQIIFEELSTRAYKQCYGSQNRPTLETIAIKLYLQNYTVEHIPIVSSEMAKEHEDMLNIVTKDFTYRCLIDNLIYLEEKYGFKFLNTMQCEQLFEKIKMQERMILMYGKDDMLLRAYNLGNEAVDAYENEILINIYNYSTSHKYDNALMFIGAAHRKSVIQKIQNYKMNNQLKLNWTFYNQEDIK